MYFPRPLYRVVALILFFVICQQLYYLKDTPVNKDYLKAKAQLSCENLKGLDDLFVILRTGSTEAPRKLPAHFSTTLRCIPHYAIYSDYEEDIDGHHIYNALDEVNPDLLNNHSDFEFYRRLQQGGRNSFTPEELQAWATAKNTNSGRDSPFWKLDKWKFLPVADKALRQQPDAKWYIFIESDTYMLWPTLLEWLSHFDPSEPHYLGMQMQIGDVVFAYGGAGFAVSHAALKKAVELRRTDVKAYDDFTVSHWAGDCILGKLLRDAGVNLMWSYPTLSGGSPADTDFNTTFGGPDKKPWCYFSSSYHHLPPAEYAKFAEFEAAWNQENAFHLRHRDVFRFYILPQIKSEAADWDNLSDREGTGVSTLADCRKTCETQPECMQFSFSGKTCKTFAGLMLGTAKTNTETDRITSGWITERLKSYVDDMDTNCSGHDWILP